MFGWIDLVEAGWRVALDDRHLHHCLCAFGSRALLTRHPRGIAEGLIFGGSAGASALADPAQESGATVALGQLSNRLAVEQLAARLVKS
jgi:hypothetical protein